jgi:hypothetical protein
MREWITAAIAALGVSACAGTQELQFAPNMVRLDVGPSGTPFVHDATLRRAAELTLANGYSAFRLTPIYALAFNDYGVTVVMLRAGDPGARDAFNAAEILNARPW